MINEWTDQVFGTPEIFNHLNQFVFNNNVGYSIEKFKMVALVHYGFKMFKYFI